jgi:uncharacterized protein YkwD
MKRLLLSFILGVAFTSSSQIDPFLKVSMESIKFVESLDSANYAKISNEILIKLNNHRKENGLPPVTSNVDMIRYATMHTKKMINDSIYNHSNLNNGQYQAENIMLSHSIGAFLCVDDAYINNVDEIMFKSWKRSESHNINMLLPDVTQVGIAIYSKATACNGVYNYIIEATMVLK